MFLFLSIGTNLGNREQNLRDALCLLDTRVGIQLACSSIYRSRPQGFVSDNDFANIVVAYETERTLEEVLLLTQQIERDLGRTHKSVDGIYHDRIIDIDLLLAKDGDCMLEHHSPTLTIPHPRMHERDFVTIPLQEVKHILSSTL